MSFTGTNIQEEIKTSLIFCKAQVLCSWPSSVQVFHDDYYIFMVPDYKGKESMLPYLLTTNTRLAMLKKKHEDTYATITDFPQFFFLFFAFATHGRWAFALITF